MDIDLNPSYKQHLAYESLLKDDGVKYLLFGGGANGGKSWLGCEWILLNCMRFIQVRYMIARKELTKLKRTTLRTFFKVASHHNFKQDVHYKYSGYSNTIFFPSTGSEIMLIELIKKPSDPLFEDLGSLELTGGFIDESGQINFLAFDILKGRIGRQNNTKYSIPPKLLLTCNPTKNWLYSTFFKPDKEGTLPKEYKFIQSLVGDNPYREDSAISQLQSIRDKATKERLLFGNWDYEDDPACLFEYDDIQDLFTNKADKSDTKYISCDVARFGNDKTIIAYWEGLECKNIKRYDRTSVNDTIKLLDKACKKYGVRRSHTIVDEDGVGGGVVDGFSDCKGFINNAKPIPETGHKYSPNYANLKTQCYFKFSQLAKDGKISITGIGEKDRDYLIEELGQIKQKDHDKDNKIAIIEKEKIKESIGRSPDIADALMMRMYFEVRGVPILEPIFA